LIGLVVMWPLDGLGTTIKYLRGAAGIGLGITAK
jgi:hypothetical protein